MKTLGIININIPRCANLSYTFIVFLTHIDQMSNPDQNSPSIKSDNIPKEVITNAARFNKQFLDNN